MRNGACVAVVIPALNEEAAIGRVLEAVPEWVDDAVVVDNGSTDRTAAVAAAGGARVVSEPQRGYGAACLAGIAALDSPDVVVFLDADFSDDPSEMARLVDPIANGRAEMVIGSRVLGDCQPGALTLPQRFGNRLACLLIRLFWGVRHTDLGPFRAIRFSALRGLRMADRDYGWTVEMQVKAARRALRVSEVPVSYRRRVGKSKISGTVRGVIGAGTKILGTIFLAAADSWLGRLRAGKPREHLAIFTRYPQPGRTKTRLIPELGPEGAAALQREMTGGALETARSLTASREMPVEVRYEGGDESTMREWLGGGIEYRAQGEGDLGARMARSFREAFAVGNERALIIGTDCPEITAGLLREAFDALRKHDLVLGPARDGGYYLVGLRYEAPELFRNINWGTAEVLKETLDAARRLGLSVCQLEELEDVDRPEDLAVWERARARRRISVIIPALDEEEGIAETLAALGEADDLEVIVVDGGSTDRTVQLAEGAGARVLSSQPGRARQMNAGAAAASGGMLLFLHADTVLPGSFAQHVRRILSDEKNSGGAFRLRIGAPSLSLRIIEWVANLRSRLLGMPYGDQALFMRGADFRALGGFPEAPLLEDFEMVRRLRRRGRIVIAPAEAVSSARRWLRIGPWRATLINQAIVASHYLGVSRARLARWYHR